jgi:hypothetical protein
MLVLADKIVCFKMAHYVVSDDPLENFDDMGGKRDWAIIGSFCFAGLFVDWYYNLVLVDLGDIS